MKQKIKNALQFKIAKGVYWISGNSLFRGNNNIKTNLVNNNTREDYSAHLQLWICRIHN